MGAHLSTKVAEGRVFMQVVDGNCVDSLSGERIDVVCPSDGKVFASIPASGKADVDRAVGAARRAFDDGPWTRMPAVERGRLLTKLAHLIEENATELAALDGGHPRPGTIVEGAPRSADGAVDIRPAGGGDRGKHLAVRRARDIDALARERVDAIAVDDLHDNAALGNSGRKMCIHARFSL